MNIKKTITITVVAAFATPLITACGGNTMVAEDVSKYVGNWDIKMFEVGGEAIDVQTLLNVTESSGKELGLVLEKDGKFTLNLYDGTGNSGTWKESGKDTLIFTVEGDDQEAVLIDGKLKMSLGEGESAMTMIFEKEDKVESNTENTESATGQTDETQETSSES